jgi:predicted molibdopterin-dependent oxidoreductase YjgC
MTSLKGVTEVQVKVTDRSMVGTVFVPTHYREVPVNALVAHDPVKEKGVTYVDMEKIERIEFEEKSGESQVSKLKKTVQEIQEKKRRAAKEAGPEVTGG